MGGQLATTPTRLSADKKHEKDEKRANSDYKADEAEHNMTNRRDKTSTALQTIISSRISTEQPLKWNALTMSLQLQQIFRHIRKPSSINTQMDICTMHATTLGVNPHLLNTSTSTINTCSGHSTIQSKLHSCPHDQLSSSP